MIEQAAQEYAKPDTYTGNRTLYDSGPAKYNAKKKLFASQKKVIDPYTGEALELTIKDAKARYGKDWQKHLAESDHNVPLEKIHEKTKNNAWLRNEDIKQVANSDDNIVVTSRKFNNPKRSRTNEEYVNDLDYLKSKGVELTEEGKARAIKDERTAMRSIDRQLRRATAKNIASTSHQAGMYGAVNAGGTAAVFSITFNIRDVVSGKKTGQEAVNDIVKDAGKGAVTGYVMNGSVTALTHTMASSSSAFIQGLAKSNVPAKVITAVVLTGKSFERWGNGEITTQQLLLEVGEKGIGMVTMSYAMAAGQMLIPIPIIGAAIGAMVGSAIMDSFCGNLMRKLQIKELEHQERLRIIAECNAAAELAREFRAELESYLDSYFEEYRSCFDTALSAMQFAYKTGDADTVIASANKITRKLGGEVKFETVNEFKSFLDSDECDVL